MIIVAGAHERVVVPRRCKQACARASTTWVGHMMRTALTLDTPRLRLRQFAESDFDDYAALCADAEVMRYVAIAVRCHLKTSGVSWRCSSDTGHSAAMACGW